MDQPLTADRRPPSGSVVGEESSPPCTRAVLAAGSCRAEYLRAGHGRTVLLLAADLDSGGPPARLLAALARRCRVVAPLTGVGGAPPRMQVEQFVEGLGLTLAAIVVDDSWREAAARYVAGLAGAAPRVVHVDPAEGDPAPAEVRRVFGTVMALLV